MRTPATALFEVLIELVIGTSFDVEILSRAFATEGVCLAGDLQSSVSTGFFFGMNSLSDEHAESAGPNREILRKGIFELLLRAKFLKFHRFI